MALSQTDDSHGISYISPSFIPAPSSRLAEHNLTQLDVFEARKKCVLYRYRV